jgi:hypothetical protein
MTQRQVKTIEVFLSDRRVVASEAQSVIPKGFRQATLEEVTLRYRHDADGITEPQPASGKLFR